MKILLSDISINIYFSKLSKTVYVGAFLITIFLRQQKIADVNRK